MQTVRVCNAMVLTLLLLVALLSSVQAQNYHYSNGWHPGKRSRMASYLRPGMLSDSQDDVCTFGPAVLRAINSIVQEELWRIQRTCVTDSPLQALKDAMEQMRTAGREAAEKAPEGDSKW